MALIVVVGGSVARLPGDLEESENLKTTKIKNLTLKTPKSCRF